MPESAVNDGPQPGVAGQVDEHRRLDVQVRCCRVCLEPVVDAESSKRFDAVRRGEPDRGDRALRWQAPAERRTEPEPTWSGRHQGGGQVGQRQLESAAGGERPVSAVGHRRDRHGAHDRQWTGRIGGGGRSQQAVMPACNGSSGGSAGMV